MEPTDEDISYILETLDRGQEKLQALRQQNEELFEANQKLVQLVKKLENVIEQETEGFDWEERYSFTEDDSPGDIQHAEKLELDSPQDIDEIDTQMSEAIKELKKAENFKTNK